ncbi:MAG: M48 family metallopeptidase [Candidatus Omnitrophota bacterium]
MSDRIKRYSTIKYALAIVDIIYLLSILFLFQFSGFAVWLRVMLSALFVSNEVVLIFYYCCVIFLLYFVLSLPLDFYRSYVVEHRFGLSKESFPHWFSDQIKEFFIGFLIFVILVQGFFFFLRNHPDNWWWISGLFWICFSVVLARLFPVLIIPLFFKYKKIDDEDLRQRIFNLAGKMGLKILNVYQIDFSKKTTKANAALTGLGKSKRVILTDTLYGSFSAEEIEVILAHEFAHSLLKHVIKMLILNASAVIFIFYILFKLAPMIFIRFNLGLADISGLGIWLICFVFLQACLVPLLNWISRNMERNADCLAIKFSGNKSAFISMMEKLSEQNLADRKPSRWIKIFFFNHPPVDERIAMANSKAVSVKEVI